MFGKADAYSKETTYAGLPKAAKLMCIVADAGNVAFFNTRFDTIAFNYGGFGIRPNATAGLFDGIIIQEPGVYEIAAQVAITNGAGNTVFQIAVNGVNQFADGSLAQNITVVGGVNLVLTVGTKIELKAGDIVSAQYLQAVATNTIGRYSTLYVEKKGGVYGV